MKIFWLFILSCFYMGIFSLSLSADCIKDDSLSTTNIKCDTQETNNSYISGFAESKDTTNIIPLYSNKNLHETVIITGININNANHILNIGTPNSARIDTEINSLNNKSGNETINIYGIDKLSMPSMLYIKNLINNYGNLTINGENTNQVTIESSSISGNLSLKNINAKLGKLIVKDISINSSQIKLSNSENINIGNIYIKNNSNLFIEASGNINSITSTDINNTIHFSDNSKINIKDINTKGIIFLQDNANITVNNNLTAQNINLLNDSKLKTDSLSLSNSLNLQNNAEIIVTNKLIAKDITLVNNASIHAGTMILNNSLKLNNSLLKVNSFEFISLSSGNPHLDITLDKPMVSQGSISTGIYAKDDINLGNTTINLHLNDTYKIKLKNPTIYEIMYSESGKINYSLDFLKNNNFNNLFDIKYNIVEGNGTSLVAEIVRKSTYCEILNCNNDYFVNFLANHLGKDSTYKNINNIKTAIDNNPSNSAVLTLKPISNDVLFLQTYLTHTIITDLSKTGNSDSNFSIFNSIGSIRDNIFNDKSQTKLLGIYYDSFFTNNFNLGISLNKSNINNSLYNVEDLGVLLLSSYTMSFKDYFISLLIGSGTNKYDKTKSNFNNDKTSSSALSNSFLINTKVFRNYSIDSFKLTPNLYYTLEYSSLNSSIENGTGLLYENKGSKALIEDFKLGLDILYNLYNDKISLMGSIATFYLTYSSDKTSVKAYEISEEYLKFSKNMYSGLGYNIGFVIDYKIKENYGLNLAYTGLFYSNNTFINSISATLKYNF